MENSLQKIGRIVFAILFIIFGLNHFMYADMLAMAVQGWPMSTLLVYVSGLGLVAAGVSFILRIKTKLAGILLAVFLLITVFGVHVPGLMSAGEDQMMNFMPNILKDLSLAAASLFFAGTIEEKGGIEK